MSDFIAFWMGGNEVYRVASSHRIQAGDYLNMDGKLYRAKAANYGTLTNRESVLLNVELEEYG